MSDQALTEEQLKEVIDIMLGAQIALEVIGVRANDPKAAIALRSLTFIMERGIYHEDSDSSALPNDMTVRDVVNEAHKEHLIAKQPTNVTTD